MRDGPESGHEDWVRALAFRPPYMNENDSNDEGKAPAEGERGGYLVLASGSQDQQIRLWRISSCLSADNGEQMESDVGLRRILPSHEFTLDDAPNTLAQAQATTMKEAATKYSVRMESLIYGHEDWIYGLCWGELPGGSRCFDERWRACQCSRAKEIISHECVDGPHPHFLGKQRRPVDG